MEKEEVKVMVGTINRVSWCVEKSIRMLEDIAKAMEVIEEAKKNGGFASFDDEFESTLYSISDYATNLVLTLSGYPLAYEKQDKVDSVEQLKLLKEKYDLDFLNHLGPSKKVIKKFEKATEDYNVKLIKEIIALLSVGEKWNRQAVQEKCEELKLDNIIIRSLKAEIDDVSIGIMSWDDFCAKQKQMLMDFLEIYPRNIFEDTSGIIY